MSTIAIIQARMGSSRLPGKVLKPIEGKAILWHVIQRLRRSRHLDKVVVATSTLSKDDAILDACHEWDTPCFRGRETDVLDRFYHCATEANASAIIRVTSDCPLIDPALVDATIELGRDGRYDHAGVATGAGALHLAGVRFPNGVDCEYVLYDALAQSWREATAASDREHVTPFIWRQPERFRLGVLKSQHDYSHLRWVVDNAEDYNLAQEIYRELYPSNPHFSYQDVLNLLKQRPELTTMNTQFIGKEGHEKVWNPEKEASHT